jgi:hypothetical protein
MTGIHKELELQAFQAAEGIITYGMTRTAGALVLVAWLVILVSAMALRAATSYSDHYAQPLHWFETFFRIGSLIYGGGQVVLPMLLTETVQYSCFVDDHGQRVSRLWWPALSLPNRAGGCRLCCSCLSHSRCQS